MEGGKPQPSELCVIPSDNIDGSESVADASQSTGPPLSPDILAAQQSLSFLQGLTDFDTGPLSPLGTTNEQNSFKDSKECKSLLDDTPPPKVSSLPDLLDSFDAVLGQTTNNTSFGDGNSKSSCGTISTSLDSSLSFTNPFSQPFPPTLPSPLSPEQSVGKVSGLGVVRDAVVLSATHINTRQPYTPSQSAPTSYSGFTVQGEKIPSIPCETGDFHSFSASHDPLSPPLEGPQATLPPPLIPTSSGSDSSSTQALGGGSSGSTEKQLKREDTIDKVYNVLGDIVQTFDNLL